MRSDQHPATQVAASRGVLWTGKWSLGRRIALFVFGLLVQFVHAIVFRLVLVPGYEWLVPIDPLVYLLTEALALAANFGFFALPFLKTPGRAMRVTVLASLVWGARQRRPDGLGHLRR